MKTISILLLLLPSMAYSQHCDTLYSHERYMDRNVEIRYRDCRTLTVDSIYYPVEWNNFDSSYQEIYKSTNVCRRLYRSGTNQLIFERWQAGDTTYFKSYYPSGKVHRSDWYVVTSEPYYYHCVELQYYENGRLRSEMESKVLTLSTRKIWYEDGSIQSITNFFQGSPRFGEYKEYFPNGQVSVLRHYSMPDTTVAYYQESTLLDEQFFDEKGQKSEKDLNEWKVIRLSVYPPMKHDSPIIDDTLYTHHRFEDQKGYANDMADLKREIDKKLKLPKTCDCRKGVVWVGFVVRKDNSIELREVEFGNDVIKEAMTKAIKTIKQWPAAKVDGQAVDTYVYTYFVLNR